MRITNGYTLRSFHHVIFRCANDGIREPFWLTVAEMRAWHREGERLRWFMARGGCIKAHWPNQETPAALLIGDHETPRQT